MSPRAFSRFMVDVELGSNPKVGRLNHAQFRCLLTGVWALAAKADPRGYLVVGGQKATAQDVAHQARCTTRVAAETLQLLRDLGMIEVDTKTGLEFCHDWWTMNPDPRPDRTNAERQARWRERHHNDSNAVSNGPEALRNDREVEEEVKGKEITTTALSAAPTVRAVFDAWIASTGRTSQTVLDSKRERLIRNALKAFPVQDVLDAVDGWKLSPHHRGENDQRTVYNDLGLLLRDAAHIEKFRDMKRGAPSVQSTNVVHLGRKSGPSDMWRAINGEAS